MSAGRSQGGGRRRGDKPTVLFLCVHNAGRPQMAAGWMHHLASDRDELLRRIDSW